VLIVGQLANAATMLMAYLLTTRLSQNPSAGLWAVALTGFVNTLPAYYVNWGRYTQLIGQVILPVALVCWMAALEHPRVSWRLMVLATLASTSLVLTHYLVAVFAGAFIGLYIIVIVARRPSWVILRHVAIVATGIGLLSGLLWLPWGINIIQGKLATIAVNATQEVSSYVANNSTITAMSPLYVKAPIVLLAFGGTLLALAQRRWRIALCALWTLGLFLLIVPDVVGIPLRGIITSFAAYIALYITVIPLAAYLLGALPQLLGRWRQPITVAGGAVLVAISLWGVSWQAGIVNVAAQQLVTPADVKAMDWIRANTPADARFLVNMLPAYADSAFIGDDGGWWIPLLAGRQNTMPPMTYIHERSSIPNYIQQVNDFGWAMQNHPLPSPEGIQLCLEAGIDYIYIGPHLRPTAIMQRIDVQSLRYRPEQFPIVYEQGGVIIFAITAK
jgi:hypothetical protein